MTRNKWTFITNHAAVLTLISHEEHLTAREIALALDITERSVIRIIKDLESEGYIARRREGRKNRYTVNTGLPLRRNDQREVSVYELLQLITHKK
jgi:DNA-binding IclR family transcriptional regulator